MNRTRKLIRNTFVFGIGNIGSKLIQFIAVPMFTLYLTTKQYGQMDLITTIVSLSLPFFSLCLYDAILRFAIDDPDSEVNIISTASFITGIMLILLLFALLALLPFNFENISLYRLGIVFLILQIVESLLSQYLKALNKNWAYAMNGLILSGLIFFLSYMMFQMMNNRLYAYFVAQIVSYLGSIIFIFCNLKGHPIFRMDAIQQKWIKKLTNYSLPLIPNQIMWWVMNTSDRLLIIFFLGLTTNGLYAVAAKIPSLTNVVVTIFMQSWQLSSFENADKEDKSAFFSEVFNHLVFFLVLFSSIVLSLLMVIMHLIASRAYFGAWIYVPMLLLGGLFSNISMFLGTNYLVGKKTNGIFRTSIMGAVLNIGLNLLLIPLCGANGASFSTLVSYFVVCVIRFIETRRTVTISIDYPLFISSTIVLMVQTLILYWGPFYLEFVCLVGLVIFNHKYLTNMIGLVKNRE